MFTSSIGQFKVYINLHPNKKIYKINSSKCTLNHLIDDVVLNVLVYINSIVFQFSEKSHFTRKRFECNGMSLRFFGLWKGILFCTVPSNVYYLAHMYVSLLFTLFAYALRSYLRLSFFSPQIYIYLCTFEHSRQIWTFVIFWVAFDPTFCIFCIL